MHLLKFRLCIKDKYPTSSLNSYVLSSSAHFKKPCPRT
eukprot:UN05507